MEAPLPAVLAAAAWEAAQEEAPTLPVPQPFLLVMVGVPLSGKSTLARAFAAATEPRPLVVENDALRPRVAAALGRPAPEYDHVENWLTYRTAWRLLGVGLEHGAAVLHDGTNLKEASRRGAYRAAEAAGAPALVAFVLTDPEEVARRAALHSADRQAAHAKLGRKRPNPAACTRPHLVVDGAASLEENVARLEEGVRALTSPVPPRTSA